MPVAVTSGPVTSSSTRSPATAEQQAVVISTPVTVPPAMATSSVEPLLATTVP